MEVSHVQPRGNGLSASNCSERRLDRRGWCPVRRGELAMPFVAEMQTILMRGRDDPCPPGPYTVDQPSHLTESSMPCATPFWLGA